MRTRARGRNGRASNRSAKGYGGEWLPKAGKWCGWPERNRLGSNHATRRHPARAPGRPGHRRRAGRNGRAGRGIPGRPAGGRTRGGSAPGGIPLRLAHRAGPAPTGPAARHHRLARHLDGEQCRSPGHRAGLAGAGPRLRGGVDRSARRTPRSSRRTAPPWALPTPALSSGAAGPAVRWWCRGSEGSGCCPRRQRRRAPRYPDPSSAPGIG